MKIIKLECLLMDNREIMLGGRSLGRLSNDEIKKYTEPLNNESKRT